MCGIYPDAIVIGESCHLLSSCRYIKGITLVPSHQDAFDKLLELYGNKKNKVFVLTGEDKMTECLNKNRKQLQNFYFFSMSEAVDPLFYFQKNNQNALAQESGFLIPKSFLWKRDCHWENLDQDLFPVITKAPNSLEEHWKDSTAICKSNEELNAFLRTYPGNALLIQQYIRKTNELALQGISTGGGNTVDFTVCTTYKYLLEGDYSHYTVASACTNQELNEKVQKIIKDMGFSGIFEAEFLVDEQDRLWFLEINPRCTALLYLSNNASMPPAVIWALRTMGLPYPFEQCNCQLPISGISEFDDLRVRVLSGRISFSSWIRDLKACQCFCYYDPDDRQPFFSELLAMIKRKLKRHTPNSK